MPGSVPRRSLDRDRGFPQPTAARSDTLRLAVTKPCGTGRVRAAQDTRHHIDNQNKT
jgi:hypothetical protein